MQVTSAAARSAKNVYFLIIFKELYKFNQLILNTHCSITSTTTVTYQTHLLPIFFYFNQLYLKRFFLGILEVYMSCMYSPSSK